MATPTRHLRFKRSMLNGHPGNVTRAVRRVIIRGVNQGLVVTSTTDGGHSRTSWHFTKPGGAVDFGLPAHLIGTDAGRALMVAFQGWLLAQGASNYHELFGPDNALNVKNGVKITLPDGSALENQHDNHVHVAPRSVLPRPKRRAKRVAGFELPRNRRLSSRGVSLIARFEGFRGYAYNDPAGHATVGYGRLLHLGRVTAEDARRWGTKEHPKVTVSTARLMLRADARSKAEIHVQAFVKVPLRQAEYDALVSLVFNIGGGAFKSSTVLRELNAGNRFKAACAFLLFTKATVNGRLVSLPGLVRRRAAESRLFLSKKG
jgi:lysozyme